MTKIYIDTNIFFNVWNEEIDPKSKKELWRSSRDLLEKTERGEFEAITSITTIMEIVHVFRVRGKDYNEAIDDVKRLNVSINAPDSWVMIKALEYQMEYELDPYDSIAFAIAQTAGCEIFVTRDEKLIKNIRQCAAQSQKNYWIESQTNHDFSAASSPELTTSCHYAMSLKPGSRARRRTARG